MLEGILFDNDGVLVDSEKHYKDAVNETLKRLNIDLEVSTEEFIKRWMIEQTATPGLIKDYGLKIEIKKFRDIKTKVFCEMIETKVEIMPYAKSLVESLYGKYPLGVVSSAWRDRLFARLNKFDYTNFFQVIIGHEDVIHTKPHPEPYEKGLVGLGLQAENVAVIEDTTSGAWAAKKAGCKVVAYPNGFTRDLDFSHANAIVYSLNDVNEDFLRNLF